MKKKYWILLILLLTVLSGGGYMVFKQHTEKEKMNCTQCRSDANL